MIFVWVNNLAILSLELYYFSSIINRKHISIRNAGDLSDQNESSWR